MLVECSGDRDLDWSRGRLLLGGLETTRGMRGGEHAHRPLRHLGEGPREIARKLMVEEASFGMFSVGNGTGKTTAVKKMFLGVREQLQGHSVIVTTVEPRYKEVGYNKTLL